jgi:hypothetical protein
VAKRVSKWEVTPADFGPPADGGSHLGSLLRLKEGNWWLTQRGEWTIAYRLAPEGDECIVAEVRVFPAGGSNQPNTPYWSMAPGTVPTGGVPDSLLRSLSTRTIFTGLTWEEIGRIRDALGPRMAESLGITATTKPAKITEADKLRARVAAAYAAAWPRTRDANQVVSEALGGETIAGQFFPSYSPRAVRDLVSDARTRLHFLTDAPEARRPGGSLTPAGRMLLGDSEHQRLMKRVDRVISERQRQKRATKRKAKK